MENKKDLVDVPSTIKKSINIIPVKTVDEVLKVVLTKSLKPVEWVEVDQIAKKNKSKEEQVTKANQSFKEFFNFFQVFFLKYL